MVNIDWVDDLHSSEGTVEINYGFCIPLKEGGFAWLVDMGDDVYIKKSDDGYWYNKNTTSKYRIKVISEYINEIQSGEGNWIINPINDNSDLKWHELDYENASVIERYSDVVKQYSYEIVKDNQ